jgi:Zn-dependent M28 family amino/carboxypeptidase
VVADTRTGRRDGTVVLGAHVDSVPAGPGINDDGTGVATLVEIAGRLAASGRPPAHRVRFAFWGAEELGLYGSRAYVASLSQAGRAEIGAYVNLDMTGSPNPVRLVYDGRAGPPGSQRIEDALRAPLRAAGLRVGETGLRGGSDHASFARAGIPVGGVFTGADAVKARAQARAFGGRAGRPLDPCYHRACDTVANVDERVLGELATAVAAALETLAGP